MTIMKKLLSLAIAIAFSVAGLLGQDVGDDAPEFSYQSLTGDTIKLSDHQWKSGFSLPFREWMLKLQIDRE